MNDMSRVVAMAPSSSIFMSRVPRSCLDTWLCDNPVAWVSSAWVTLFVDAFR